jgi:UDP-2-acetamido-2,6-beta-L-arabino-hexul-4-ose reductase
MNVLITGSNGFIAKNLIERLSTLDDIEIMKFSKNHSQTELEEMVLRADIIYHLAGVNRPKDSQEI